MPLVTDAVANLFFWIPVGIGLTVMLISIFRNKKE